MAEAIPFIFIPGMPSQLPKCDDCGHFFLRHCSLCGACHAQVGDPYNDWCGCLHRI